MITYNPLLCLDFYKTCHAEQYPKGLTKMVSYYTPRMSRLSDTEMMRRKKSPRKRRKKLTKKRK